jgi:methylmalonyl-CoA mutase N-terminal domain/subunit
MNEHIRDRILRKLDTLNDERGYQILDYVEFLESRYAERQSPGSSAFTRFTEAIEDKLRAGKVSASAIAETVGFMNRAANVLNSALETGKTMATEFVTTARGTPAQPGPPPSTPSSASSPAHETKDPGGSGEKL